MYISFAIAMVAGLDWARQPIGVARGP